MKNKKGFTLIELLAVIVILAIIMVIAVPQILNVIENSRKTAAIESAQFFVDAVNKNNQFASTSLSSDYELYRDGKYNVSNVKNTLKLKNTWPSDNSTFEIANGKVKTACLKVNKYNLSCDGKWCSVTNSECENENYTYTGYFWRDVSTDGYTLNNGWYTTLNPNSKVYRRTDGTTPEVCVVFSKGTACMTSSYYNGNYSTDYYNSDFSTCSSGGMGTFTSSNINNSCLKGYALSKAEEMLSKGASSCSVQYNGSYYFVHCGGNSAVFCRIFSSVGTAFCLGENGGSVHVDGGGFVN